MDTDEFVLTAYGLQARHAPANPTLGVDEIIRLLRGADRLPMPDPKGFRALALAEASISRLLFRGKLRMESPGRFRLANRLEPMG